MLVLNRRMPPLTQFALSSMLVLVFLAFANFTAGGNGGTGAYVTTAVGCIVVSAAITLWGYPRLERRRERSTLVLGILAFLTCVVFWTGAPFVLGVPAVALGSETLRRGREATIGMALGAVAVLAGALLCVVL